MQAFSVDLISKSNFNEQGQRVLLKPLAVELLAPARDLEAGFAAIDCGADAVYIGAPRFGAREQAGNTLQEIESLAGYAHRCWARVYVTLNTLLHDDELEEAVALARRLHDLGADGLIIQDTGLLEASLPPIPLIASTQMHNHTPERVAFLEGVGFQRAILARELSLEQIGAIRRSCGIELECFVHGALCVSYSGQCYLSLARGGRSGNRGQCAQPCRLPYRLVDGAGKTVSGRRHLLSLRDLNLSGQLSELLDAGITSFKIEGRLKDASYVKNIVTFYRQKLDPLLEERGMHPSSSGRAAPAFTPDPAGSFNRSFTTYFIHGRGSDLTAWATPKHSGEPVGLVLRCQSGELRLEPGARPLHNGDGLAWFDDQGELQGVRVNRVEGERIILDQPLDLPPGTRILRNHDHEFTALLKKSAGSRVISVEIDVVEEENGLLLRVQDEDGVTAEIRAEVLYQPARDPGQALQTARTQLAKSGGTLFVVKEVRLGWRDPWFLPLSALNRMRRDLLTALLEERLRLHPLQRIEIVPNGIPFPVRSLDFHGNVLNRRARAFYTRHGVEKIAPAAESGIDLRAQRVMTSRYCLRGELGLCGGQLHARGFAEPLHLIDDQNQRLRLEFRCDDCEMDIYLAD